MTCRLGFTYSLEQPRRQGDCETFVARAQLCAKMWRRKNARFGAKLPWSCSLKHTICCDELHLAQDIVVFLPDVSLHVLHVKVNWCESCGLMCFQ